MEIPGPVISVSWPTDEQRIEAFEAYTLAIGKVAYAWNHLHEALGQLFAVVTGIERPVALAMWYSIKSDRGQRDILHAAVSASAWPDIPAAAADLDWLLKKINFLSERRNDAVHMPASLYIGGGRDGSNVMGAAFWQGNPRARKMIGKQLLEEFAWCETYAERLIDFTKKVETGLAFPKDYPWHTRPQLPDPPA